MRRLRLLPAVWLVLLLAAPTIAWLLGARQPLLENRAKEAFPTINRSSVRDPATFSRLDTFVLDRLPFRQTALEVRSRVELDLFHDSPNPDIAIGHDGWLYYAPELGPCRPGGQPASDPADAWELLARTFAAAGYRPILAAPGSKLLIHSHDAPALDEEAERCADALERHVAARLAEIPGGLSLDARLRRLEADGDATFLRYDSHWNWRGRLLFVRRLVELIDPRLARAARIRAGGTYERDGDLARLVGATRTEEDRLVVADPPPRALPPGRVLLIGDSQMERSLQQPVPGGGTLQDRILPGQLTCDWPRLSDGGCDAALRSAHVVLIEKVARDAPLVTTACWRPLAVAAERLGSGRPARWTRLDAGAALGRRLTIPAAGTATVRVTPQADGTGPRLLRFRVLRGSPQADGTPAPVAMVLHARPDRPAVPCATPAQPTGGALLVPLPAGVRAADLAIELRSAPGAQIGRPQEIPLDGQIRVRRR